jgi:hypothetical protein
MIREIDILVGADPEVFVTTNSGIPRSGHGLIPGTKERPYRVEHGAVQVDGMALEFNIDPAKTAGEFSRNITSVMKQMEAMIPKNRKIAIKSVVTFPKALMAATPIEAKLLGCEPDWNGYEEDINPSPDANTNMRTAAGHIHIGWGNGFDIGSREHLQACFRLAKQMDLYVGLPGLWFDKDSRRQRLYGKPGTFRPKTYGMEYRSPSNWWLKSEAKQEFVFDMVRRGTSRLADAGGHVQYENSIRHTLSNRDKSCAWRLIHGAGISQACKQIGIE